MKVRPGDPAAAALEEAKRVIANLAMEVEILKKARALAADRRS